MIVVYMDSSDIFLLEDVTRVKVGIIFGKSILTYGKKKHII
jgi:hypothetical protein